MLAFSQTLNAQQITALKNVNVIDGTGAAAQPNRTSAWISSKIWAVAG
jgi:hypothetical protein